MNDVLRLTELISKYLEVGNSDFYICTRDKSAFAVGTMSLDDFTEVDDEIAADMAEWLAKRGVFFPPCKPGDKAYSVINDVDGEIYIDVETITDVSTKGLFLNGECTLYRYNEIGEYNIFLDKEKAEMVAEKWRRENERV